MAAGSPPRSGWLEAGQGAAPSSEVNKPPPAPPNTHTTPGWPEAGQGATPSSAVNESPPPPPLHTHTLPQGGPRLECDSQDQAQSSRGQQADAPLAQVWGLQTRRCPHGAPRPGPNASSAWPRVGGCPCPNLGLPSYKAGWWERSPWAGEDGGERGRPRIQFFTWDQSPRFPASETASVFPGPTWAGMEGRLLHGALLGSPSMSVN